MSLTFRKVSTLWGFRNQFELFCSRCRIAFRNTAESQLRPESNGEAPRRGCFFHLRILRLLQAIHIHMPETSMTLTSLRNGKSISIYQDNATFPNPSFMTEPVRTRHKEHRFVTYQRSSHVTHPHSARLSLPKHSMTCRSSELRRRLIAMISWCGVQCEARPQASAVLHLLFG